MQFRVRKAGQRSSRARYAHRVSFWAPGSGGPGLWGWGTKRTLASPDQPPWLATIAARLTLRRSVASLVAAAAVSRAASAAGRYIVST